jgi:hypothetical protein
MSSPNWHNDDELLLDLRRALARPPIDERVVEAARLAFAWRSVDADLELAQLVYDSYVDENHNVRSVARPAQRALSFQGECHGVEVELSDTGIDGQLTPPLGAEVTLMTARGIFATATTDPIGCFTMPPAPSGPIRFECSTAGRRMITEWVTVRATS